MSPDESFDAFLAALAHAPGAPVQVDHLPEELRAATLVDDRYRIETLVGRGGMGEVYRATDLVLARPVAIKLSLAVGDLASRQWLREAEALARLSHANVVDVFRVGTHAGRPFIAMAWIEGETLAEWARAGTRSWLEVVACFRLAGAGLAAAHAVGLVHRDFKPHNVLRGHDGRVCVADFGLAALPHADATPEDSIAIRPRRERWRTASKSTARVVGTLGYLPPEQFVGEQADPRSDQFSFCASLWEGLFGRLPYGGGRAARIHERMIAGDLGEPTRRDVPTWLVDALRRGLDPVRSRRWADMAALLAAIDPEPRRRRRRRLAWRLAALASLPFVALWLRVTEPAARRCATAAAEIDRVWNRERATALASAFTSSESPLAAAASSHAIETLDEHAASWAAQRLAVCERATKDDVEPALTCLERDRLELAAAIEVLVRADRDAVASSDAVLSALPDPERCADVSTSTPADAEPDDRQAARDVREARHWIANAGALTEAGHAAEGIALADDALALARRANFEPAVAEALLVRGRARADLGHPGAGVADFEDAYWTATAVRHDDLAAKAARSLLSDLVADPRQWEEAVAWSRIAGAAEQRVTGRAEPSWQLHRARGNAARLADRFDEARAEFEAALDGHIADGASVSSRVPLITTLATIEYYVGNNRAGLERAEQALALARAELPRDHPALATALIANGRALSYVGRRGEAVAPIREALAIRKRLHGPTGAVVVESTNTLGDALLRSGDPEGSLAAHREALALALARDPVDGYEAALSWTFVGKVLLELGRYDESEEALLQAIAGFEQAGGAGAFDRGTCYVSLGSARAFRGAFADALDAYDNGIAILTPLLPRDSLQLAGAYANRTMTRVAMGEPEASLADLEEARQRVRDGGHEDTALAALVENIAASAYMLLGRHAEAVDAALRSVEIQRRVDPEPSTESLRHLSATIDVLLECGEPARARELALEALQLVDRIDATGTVSRPELTFKLGKVEHALGHHAEARRLLAEARRAATDAVFLEEIGAWERDR